MSEEAGLGRVDNEDNDNSDGRKFGIQGDRGKHLGDEDADGMDVRNKPLYLLLVP